MKRGMMISIVSVLLVISACADQGDQGDQDTRSLKEAIANLYNALEASDAVQSAKSISPEHSIFQWLNEKNGGRLLTQNTDESSRARTASVQKSFDSGCTLRFEIRPIVVRVYGDVAIQTLYQRPIFACGGQVLDDFWERRTNVWAKNPEGWQIVHAHGSPFTEDPGTLPNNAIKLPGEKFTQIDIERKQ